MVSEAEQRFHPISAPPKSIRLLLSRFHSASGEIFRLLLLRQWPLFSIFAAMKQRNIMQALLAAWTLTIYGCAGKPSSENNNISEQAVTEKQSVMTDTQAVDSLTAPTTRMATDSVSLTDSVAVGGCAAVASVRGLYPAAGTSLLTDSVRAWIGESMATNMQDTRQSLFKPTAAELASGTALAKRYVEAMLEQARGDFAGIEERDNPTSYEYYCNFSPAFESDSLTTYAMGIYVYFGGAHGGALGLEQTFDNNTGIRLTADNVFIPDSIQRLTDLLRRELWEQYFKEDASEGETLRDVLMIDPDSLRLPSSAPAFLADGVAFCYQQYEIACYAAGMPACVIPYSELRPLMRPRVRGLLPE